MTAKIIDGIKIAKEIRSEVAAEVIALKAKGVIPGLAAILVGDDPASATYVQHKEKAALEAGIRTKTFRFPRNTTEAEVVSLVKRLNGDLRFHGILVQLPLPEQINEGNVLNAVSPAKDIDGLHPMNMGKLLMGEPDFIPCTPAGVQQMLLRSGYDPEGKHVVVCGSGHVGRPTVALFMQRKKGANATVTACDIATRDMGSITRQADILIVAVGKPKLITADMVREGAVVIDVGISRVKDPTKKSGYRLVGDVDFEAVKEKAEAISPVPGGVGPVTVAMLLVSTVKAAKLARGL